MKLTTRTLKPCLRGSKLKRLKRSKRNGGGQNNVDGGEQIQEFKKEVEVTKKVKTMLMVGNPLLFVFRGPNPK